LSEEIANAPRLVERWPEVRAWWVGRTLVAHNAATEQKVIRQTAPLHRTGLWIDTLRLSRMAYPDEPSHALEALLDRLGLMPEVRALCPGRQPHDALFDAVGCARLLLHLLVQPGWHDASVAALASARPKRTSGFPHRRTGGGG
jgi:DNA polymerase III epsilon subunit-like protein